MHDVLSVIYYYTYFIHLFIVIFNYYNVAATAAIVHGNGTPQKWPLEFDSKA